MKLAVKLKMQNMRKKKRLLSAGDKRKLNKIKNMADCAACKVLQFYADRDSFISAVECVLCAAVIAKTVEEMDNVDKLENSELKPKMKPDEENLTDSVSMPILEELPSSKNEHILVCENSWCTYNIHIKQDDMDTTKAQRAETMLNTHEAKCKKHKQQGRRFKRVVSSNGHEQGCYVDINKKGLGLPKPKVEAE